MRVLLLSATLLLVGGWFLYDLGSQVNQEPENEDSVYWDQSPGDKWLYIGGLMMLISGSLGRLRFESGPGVKGERLR